VLAGDHEKMIFAVKADDFELAETDISNLAIGESQTIETASGKVVDILRTEEGAEIYVDGELLEMDFSGEPLHEKHMMQKHVEVICDTGDECDKNIFVVAGDDTDTSGWVTDDGKNVVIHKEIEITCESDEDEDPDCNDKMVWISEGDNIDLEKLHQMHIDREGEAHKVIVVKKHKTIEE
jgi:hypothetical protein